jgi:hypothetical protein
MKLRTAIVAALGMAGLFGFVIASAAQSPKKGRAAPVAQKGVDAENAHHAQRMLDEGKNTFRYDTFGSEAFWGDLLQLHKAIAGEKNGGVGPGVSPKTHCPLA